MPGGTETQKMRRQAWSLKVKMRSGGAGALYGDDAIGVVDADEGGGDDAEGKQPLEDAGAFAADVGGEALCEVERDDDADEAAGDALEEAAEKERDVAVRERDERGWR